MSEAVTARHVALDLIGAVLRRKRPLDDAIEDSSAMHQLSGRDRAFARLLVATVLRRLGQIDALIADCLNIPLAPRAAVVQDILRLQQDQYPLQARERLAILARLQDVVRVLTAAQAEFVDVLLRVAGEERAARQGRN